MSAYTTLSITRSKAKELILNATIGEIPVDVLERFVDSILEERLYNCIIVDDGTEENDDDMI